MSRAIEQPRFVGTAGQALPWQGHAAAPEAAGERYDPAVLSRGLEWYVTGLICFLMLEGVLNPFVDRLVAHPAWVTFFTRLTTYNFRPGEALMYFIALPAGAVLMFSARRQWHRPTPGKWMLLGVWVLYFGWAIFGAIRGNPLVLPDIRGLVLPSLIVPWVAVAGKNLRYEVVLSRVIRFAIPLALVNLVFATVFFREGMVSTSSDDQVSPNVRRDIPLMLPFFLAFARTITSGRGTRSAVLALAVLAGGIVAGLAKATLATFLGGNLIMIGVFALTGRRAGNMRLFKLIGSTVLLAIVVGGVLSVIFRLGDQSAERWLRRTVLKQGLPDSDVSGGRFDMWRYCVGRWAEDPVLGTGLGGGKLWVVHKGTGAQRPLAVHNLPIQTLMQTGTLGFLIFAACAFTWIRRYLRTMRRETDPVRIWPRFGLGAFALAMMFNSLYSDFAVGPAVFLLWMAIALDASSQSSTPPAEPEADGSPIASAGT